MNREELARLWMDSSLTRADIARILDVSEAVVQREVKRHKLPSRRGLIPTHGVSKERFEEVWMDFSLTKAQAAFELGIPKSTCMDLAGHYGLPRERGGRCWNSGEKSDPTPEEIKAMCAMIRSRWSDEERWQREGKRVPELAAFSYQGPMHGFSQRSLI